MATKETFILGADDPEMRRVEQILDERGIDFVYAINSDGTRVDAGSAYQDAHAEVDPETEIVFVETDITGIEPAKRIDHHRESDPGYHLPAGASWRASSIGQLATRLRNEGGAVDHVLAAMDHNFPAAANGEVIGINPANVIHMKICEIAHDANLDPDVVRQEIEELCELISRERTVDIAGRDVLDLRELDLGTGYTEEYLALQTACAVSGRAALLRTCNVHDPREKTVLTGYVNPIEVVVFKELLAPSQGLVDAYGVPMRGYAGAYRPLESDS